jgi:acyl-CoA dehydrogenase
MDLAIPPELAMIKQAARDFVTRELAPLEAQVDQEDDIPAATLQRLRQRALELGFYGFNLPAAVGGGGVGAVGEVLIGEEVGRTSVPLGEAIGRLPQSLVFCKGDQLDWLLGPALRAEVSVCNALTEPEAGSDLGGIQTRAVRHGSEWCISGSKQFISGAETSDYIFVLVVTDPAAPLRRRFTTFIVERKHPGLEFVHRFRKMGWHGHHLSAFALDECVVGEDHVLGEVGAGFDIIMASINTMRLYIAAKCVGAAQHLLSLASNYAQTRRTFGRRLGEHQAIQFMLANMDVELEAARLLVLAGAWKADTQQPDVRIAASRAKLYASEMAGRAADAAMQIFGGAGFMAELPIERMYRDLRGYRIGEGSSEMQRIQIARHLLAD